MRSFVSAAAAVGAMMAPVPASAQVFFSNDPAAGDGSEAAAVPGYGANRVRDFDNAVACRVLRERPLVWRGVAGPESQRNC